MSGINLQAFNYSNSTFPPILKIVLKDPGPLNSKKLISAAKQLFMCTDRIMWQPASKIRYQDDTCMISSQYRLYTSIIKNNSSYIFADFRQMGMLVLQKIRETLKSVREIFDVSSRYRSIPGEYM